jgi:predicted ATPase
MATSPQRKKDRTLEALLRQLEGLAHQHPVVMVVEDALWIDPTSLELLDLTVERVGTTARYRRLSWGKRKDDERQGAFLP